MLAPWEGSAFQALGLELSMTELDRPSWRQLLENVVDVEIDFATRHKLPGFLSESYSGEGVQYTGSVGIPDITVSPRPRITDAASLYTLGAAYSVAPDKIERFLAANWPVVSKLLTDHGPWEGYNVTRQEVIQFQTTAHTLALILGLLGTGSDHMKPYLDSKGLGPRLDQVFKPGEDVDLLSGGDPGLRLERQDEPDPVQARQRRLPRPQPIASSNAGIAFVPSGTRGVNLSGGLLSLRYRSSVPDVPGRHHPQADGQLAGRRSDPHRDLLPLRGHRRQDRRSRSLCRPRPAWRRSRKSSSPSGPNPRVGRSTCRSAACMSRPSRNTKPSRSWGSLLGTGKLHANRLWQTPTSGISILLIWGGVPESFVLGTA